MSQKPQLQWQNLISIAICFLSSTFATSFLYWIFYHFSSQIWSLNSTLPLSEYTLWMRMEAQERDGIEMYVLYVFMFINLGLTFILYRILSNIPKKFIFLFLITPVLYLKTIGFHLPMALVSQDLHGMIFVGLIMFITILILIYFEKIKWSWIPIALTLLFICLFSASGISRQDYVFIYAPALRLLHGFGLNESFFQYDYLISILAAIWMKFKLSIWAFPILGRLSHWALLIGIYLFSRKYFSDKRLSVFLLICLTIVKIYGNSCPPDLAFQITPLRLDLWLVVLVLAFYKGIEHWIVAAALGFLIIFHHLFGVIYVLSYLILITVLILPKLFGTTKSLLSVSKEHFLLFRTNIILLLICLLLSRIFFESHSGAIDKYLMNGFGFLPTNAKSFFWYIPIMISTTCLLLWKNREALSVRYFETGLFLVFLAIGNLIYFFGRSHENNLICISASLLLVFFLLIDLLRLELCRFFEKVTNKFIIPIIGLAIILLISVSYSANAVEMFYLQLLNVKKLSFVSGYDKQMDYDKLKELTHSSSKVIFLSTHDFFYYYEGGYDLPKNYKCFTRSWFLINEYVDFLNEQLKDNYYIIAPSVDALSSVEILKRLKNAHYEPYNDILVISHVD